MPEPVSGDGTRILGLWRGRSSPPPRVGALVWGLDRLGRHPYRRRNDDLPSQTPENIPLELSTPRAAG
jgi:cytochrome c oxidase subunit 2